MKQVDRGKNIINIYIFDNAYIAINPWWQWYFNNLTNKEVFDS
jgi:hypothetical protein